MRRASRGGRRAYRELYDDPASAVERAGGRRARSDLARIDPAPSRRSRRSRPPSSTSTRPRASSELP
jgi:hypothetical protein